MTETEAKWSERIRQWRASGQSAKEFADGREFKASTLVYWASHIRDAVGDAASTSKRGREIRMVRTIPRPTRDEVMVQVGLARVVVHPGFDAELLRQVVQALGGER